MIFFYGLCNIISDDLMLKKDKKVKRKLLVLYCLLNG